MKPLRYIGVDPSTDDRDSPTVWFDEEAQELVFQGWKPGDELHRRIAETPAPNHAPGIPDHEYAIRMPKRMVAVIRKACDVAEGLDG